LCLTRKALTFAYFLPSVSSPQNDTTAKLEGFKLYACAHVPVAENNQRH